MPTAFQVRIFNALPVGELRAGTMKCLDLQAQKPPLRDFDVAVLTRLLSPELETVLLAENAIGFPGIQLLGSVLPNLPSLKSLDLHANGEVTPSIAAKLLNAMDVPEERCASRVVVCEQQPFGSASRLRAFQRRLQRVQPAQFRSA